MKTVCETNKCTGCMACTAVCSKDAIKIEDNLGAYNAVIMEDKCINCDACHRVCQKNTPVKTVSPERWYQGWAEDFDIRSGGASGGFAGAVSSAFIKNGGYVVGCAFENGVFGFHIENTQDGIRRFAGSKYVKSNPSGVYRKIRELLKSGEKVLFIGLPCQVAALKNYISDNLQSKLYTIDLICHGTPSPKLLEMFLNQYGYSLEKIKNIQFRVKGKFPIYNNYKSVITAGVCDRYMIAFLNSISYTENCYECDFAKKERVSDLTLGDSWGTSLGADEVRKGVSLVLCQNEKGDELLKSADLHLEPVDIETAVENNQQLKHSAYVPEKRNEFFDKVKMGSSFNKLIFKLFPKQCIRQEVKKLLISVNAVKGKLDYGIRILEIGDR